jgi:hypothetical protein
MKPRHAFVSISCDGLFKLPLVQILQPTLVWGLESNISAIYPCIYIRIYEFGVCVCVLILLMQKAITYFTYVLRLVLIKMDDTYITYGTYATQCTYVTYCTYCTVMVAWLDKKDPKMVDGMQQTEHSGGWC